MDSKLKEKCENYGRSENMVQVCESDGPQWSARGQGDEGRDG